MTKKTLSIKSHYGHNISKILNQPNPIKNAAPSIVKVVKNTVPLVGNVIKNAALSNAKVIKRAAPPGALFA